MSDTRSVVGGFAIGSLVVDVVLLSLLVATAVAIIVLRDLFAAYVNDPAALPDDWRDWSPAGEATRHERRVCDFIAGMTDRYAVMRHRRLFDLDPHFR